MLLQSLLKIWSFELGVLVGGEIRSMGLSRTGVGDSCLRLCEVMSTTACTVVLRVKKKRWESLEPCSKIQELKLLMLNTLKISECISICPVLPRCKRLVAVWLLLLPTTCLHRNLLHPHVLRDAESKERHANCTQWSHETGMTARIMAHCGCSGWTKKRNSLMRCNIEYELRTTLK